MLFSPPPQERVGVGVEHVNKRQKRKPVWTPGGQWGSSFWLTHRVTRSCSRLHAFLPQCVSSLDNRDPVLYSVAQKIKQLFFFPSIIQRAEVWGSCQGSASRGCNKMCGSLLRRGCFSSYKSIHTNPQPPGDRQFTPWQAFRVGAQLKQSNSLVALSSKSHISSSALKWSEFRMGSRLFSKSLSPPS